jgi:3-deoxy-D-manno-octulosonate 8-phosphate phosphatase (KDO 8-P phosphatase)
MIELIVIDVDGTMTDGKIYYTNEGDEIKAFNIKDGLMIKSWNELGKKSAIITGRVSKIVDRRAKELKITYVKQGIRDKAFALEEIIKELGIDYSNVAIIGDDMNDFSMMKLVKKSFAPVDANPFIYDFVEYPLTKK